MNNLQIFNNPKFGDIRVAGTKDEPLFCLADVCKALDLNNPSQVKTRLSKKGVYLIDNHALYIKEGVNTNELGNSSTNFINEGNLYRCVFQSRKSDAEEFQDWVCEEVLPSIRKNGMYATDITIDKMISDPDFAIKLLTNLKDERTKRIAAEETIEIQKPKVLFADAVTTSTRCILVAELAKIITQNGYEIGQNRLFKWMRNNGFLCSKGEYYNQPTQRAMEAELFEIKKTAVTHSDGHVTVSVTTKVTGKGQVYFVNKFSQK